MLQLLNFQCNSKVNMVNIYLYLLYWYVCVGAGYAVRNTTKPHSRDCTLLRYDPRDAAEVKLGQWSLRRDPSITLFPSSSVDFWWLENLGQAVD